MHAEVDIKENEILDKYPQVLEILLRDHTTQKNILWATNNYKQLGKAYQFSSPILLELITGRNGNIIMPRVKKDKILQQTRVRDMAEVFTPSWICCTQNNLVDTAWFGRDNVFNFKILNTDGTHTWQANSEKVTFPNSKTWRHYIRDTRLELACGEAPYTTSRYDTTTGEFIPVYNRIGLLDRKLRVVNENTTSSRDWLKAAQTAYKNTYAFEWQGDSLLLAREAMLVTFVENYLHKFGKEPSLISIQHIAKIISWNVWQMDGLKGVVPNSCTNILKEGKDLFGNFKKEIIQCKGCESQNIMLHNGTYFNIIDWKEKDKQTGSKGKIIRFVDLFKINICKKQII